MFLQNQLIACQNVYSTSAPPLKHMRLFFSLYQAATFTSSQAALACLFARASEPTVHQESALQHGAERKQKHHPAAHSACLFAHEGQNHGLLNTVLWARLMHVTIHHPATIQNDAINLPVPRSPTWLVPGENHA